MSAEGSMTRINSCVVWNLEITLFSTFFLLEIHFQECFAED